MSKLSQIITIFISIGNLVILLLLIQTYVSQKDTLEILKNYKMVIDETEKSQKVKNQMIIVNTSSIKIIGDMKMWVESDDNKNQTNKWIGDKYEYLWEGKYTGNQPTDFDDYLQLRGSQGWELVTIFGEEDMGIIFKRKLIKK